MTWNPRDSLPPRPPGAPPAARTPLHGGSGTPPRGGAAPIDLDAPSAAPAALPTFLLAREAMSSDEAQWPSRMARSMEREMEAEGIWPEHKWEIWRRMLTRGIEPL